jgi:hypothetical protein
MKSFSLKRRKKQGGYSCLASGRKASGVKSAGGALAGSFWVVLEGKL